MGICVNIVGNRNRSHICVCHLGYHGQMCERTLCSPNPCHNTETCKYANGKLKHTTTHIRHDENYCDSSVSRKVKNFSFFFWKIMNSHDSLYFFMWVAKKINAKSQKFKRLQLFSSLKKLFFFSTHFQIFH